VCVRETCVCVFAFEPLESFDVCQESVCVRERDVCACVYVMRVRVWVRERRAESVCMCVRAREISTFWPTSRWNDSTSARNLCVREKDVCVCETENGWDVEKETNMSHT